MFHHCREHQQVSLAGHREETGHTAQAEAESCKRLWAALKPPPSPTASRHLILQDNPWKQNAAGLTEEHRHDQASWGRGDCPSLPGMRSRCPEKAASP